ncbi:hypothetical protein Ahy_A01g002460 [Arachis hypogaea]|uniref:Replication protein A 70 kDa DNA-binding subunit B/D first OB fold domain-containing protein n=1 Tax=Arachis hypogaea TaxID=3818 RepID=A0A445ER39_ARAHY|nr:hypothetical protein Ahy_A01g002460 [Arachis hypogaea]
MEEHQHPSIQEQHDPSDTIDMEQEREDHLRESILHKELKEALKVKVVETLEVDSVVEELVKEDNKEDFVLEVEEIVEQEIIKDEYDFILKHLDQAINRLPFRRSVRYWWCLVVEPMPHLFDSISKIHPPREAQRLKVRVLRTWIVPSFGNHDSNKIQATVKKQLINRFKDSIIEGQTYQMSYFSVVPNQGNYRAVEHEFKLVFLNRTTVIPVLDDAIPKTCFSFYPFDELLKMTEDYVYLVDIIGFLTYVGEEKGYVKHAKVMKMIVLELSSKELTIRCALFGEYVDEVHRFLGSGYLEQPVIVIQLAKIKFFRGQVGLQNVMHATRLFFNLNLSNMVDQSINGTQPLFITNEVKGVSLEGDFMWLTRRCTIEELHDNNEEGSFVVFGIVRSIVDERPWWYSHYVTNVTSRYRIKIAVEDDNGHAVFVLFDREAAYLLEKFKRMQVVCGDSYPVMFQQLLGKKLLLKIDTKSVGADKVCDDAAIISMFELANHDADDERTPLKNGYLGKIPSSEDEYIIDKKDLCEVLDEGITADGNCSNMKTNYRPLIDFLVKTVGKSVDDSVLLNRECSLEIEGLLNSPLVKTTAVLFAILDRFPVNVIKKETVSNPLRGREVKKNLKKVLMMLPMRSFAQLPRFSRTVIFEMF